MRWVLVGLALLLAVAGLLYRGGTAFVSTFSDATASPGVAAPGTMTVTTVQLSAPARPGRAPEARQSSASGTWRPEPSPAPQPVASNPEDAQQRLFQSRRALETTDPREFLQRAK
jgi:hypothetical protein